MTPRRIAALAALTAFLLVELSAPASSQEPPVDEDPDLVAVAASPPLGPGTYLQSLDWHPWGNPDVHCAGVDGSRNPETDVVMMNCYNKRPSDGWERWDINRVRLSPGGTQLYEIRNPYTGLCLSIEGVESGASVPADNGHDAQ